MFQLQASDFGLSTHHPLTNDFTGRSPEEDVMKLISILRFKLLRNNSVLEFVLMNEAALLVTSCVCGSDTSNADPDGKIINGCGSGGVRWKESSRRA